MGTCFKNILIRGGAEDLHKVQDRERLMCTGTTTFEGYSCPKGDDLDSYSKNFPALEFTMLTDYRLVLAG